MSIVKISFYFHCFLGIGFIFLDKPEYSFPQNMGWIVILGFITLFDELRNKK